MDRDDPVPREARTEYRRLHTAELPCPAGPYPTSRYSLVCARPLTGRTHQLRRHFKHLRHPIVGDTTYGDSSHNRLFRERYQSWRLLLHAHTLRFVHPVTREQIHLSAPVPEDLQCILDDLFGFKESGDGLSAAASIKRRARADSPDIISAGSCSGIC